MPSSPQYIRVIGQNGLSSSAGRISLFTPGWAVDLTTAKALYSSTVSITHGRALIVSHCDAINDGYGGTFVYDSTDTTTTFSQDGLGFVDDTGRRWFRVYSGAINLRWFKAKGDSGGTDNSTAIQAFSDAIALGFAGYIPAASGYYSFSTGLTHTGYLNIHGDGFASRIHYTGSGVAWTFTGPRFSHLSDFVFTGTGSATGGIYLKAAQEGYIETNVRIENFTAGYARRFSSCWTATITGGSSKNNLDGVRCDTAVVGITPGVVNNFAFNGHSFANNSGIGLDFQSGFGLTVDDACDFSNTGTAVEIARGATFPDQVRNFAINSDYIEATNCVYVGRGASSNSCAVYGKIGGTYADGATNGVHLYKCDSVTVEAQTLNGTNTIDAGVTGTTWMSENAVSDSSAAGQTTYWRPNIGSLQIKTLVAQQFLLVPTYTVSGVPSASTPAQVAYISNESGGAVLAFTDGTNWRRVTDRAIVS